jgi:hypothetical protein
MARTDGPPSAVASDKPLAAKAKDFFALLRMISDASEDLISDCAEVFALHAAKALAQGGVILSVAKDLSAVGH